MFLAQRDQGGIPEEGEEIEMVEKSIGKEFVTELDRMKKMENGGMNNGDVLLAACLYDPKR